MDEMSAVPERRDSLAGLTLDAVLSDRRGSGPNGSRTLFEIIRDDHNAKSLYAQNDRKSWKIFRDKLRLKRAGAAWTSSVHIPASDVPNHSTNTQSSRLASLMSSPNNSTDDPAPAPAPEARPQFTRRSSTRLGVSAANATECYPHDDARDISMPGDTLPSRSFKPQVSRHNSTRMAQREADEVSADPFEVARDGTRRLAVVLAEERAMSAREAVAAQEAAEAAAQAESVMALAEESAAAAAAEASDEEGGASEEVGEESPSEEAQPVRMSLMDLLEETDREMGVEGSKYMMGDDDDEEFDDEEDEEEEAEVDSGIEYNCCVCMVRHKGAAFIPCGHTFCRLCSRELYVQRGNCPLCNNFIVEILDIF